MASRDPDKEYIIDPQAEVPSVHSVDNAYADDHDSNDTELAERAGLGDHKASFEEVVELDSIDKEAHITSSGLDSSTTPDQLKVARMQSHATTASGYSTDAIERVKTEEQPVYGWTRWLTLRHRQPPPVPKERLVSREYKAGFFSQYTFQWIAPLMTLGYERPLELNDLWLVNPNRNADLMHEKLAEAFKRRRAKGGKRPLIGALYDTFRFEFILGGACQLLSSCLQVVTPFVLRYLITFAEEAYLAHFFGTAAPPVGRGIGIVIAITCMQMIQSGCTNQFIYRGMMVGGQVRAVLMVAIFDKAMKLSGRARAGGEASSESNFDNINKNEPPPGIKPGSKEEKQWLKKQLKDAGKEEDKKGDTKSKDGVSGDGQGWSNGRIVNLMSTDTYRVDQASGMFHIIWTSPIAIFITLALLLVNITYSALAGFGLLVIAMPVLGKSVRVLFNRRKAINKITDQRVGLTQEILHAVRFVKFFGWETSFLERIAALRAREIRSIQILLAIRNGINAISMSMPIFASMLAFITYSLSKHALKAAPIFSSLALFNSLRLPLNLLPMVIGQVVDATSSLSRIEEFLLAEEAQDEAEWKPDIADAVQMKDASFTWERARTQQTQEGENDNDSPAAAKAHNKKDAQPAKKKSSKKEKEVMPESDTSSSSASSTSGEEKATPFEIRDLNISIKRHELVAVIGGVGSGKTSLLAALAGDMRKTAGAVVMGASRAFCPQSAWIQNATVKDNILFGKDMESRWYNKVIDACALRPDLEMLPNGDLTEIGERGITVSGGQKQRLNIARAIYFNSDLVLMDDPLSAVDAHVGRHIMDQAICGLLKDKCRILATHQLWVLSRCDRIIWMEDGRILTVDTFDNLMANNQDFVELIAKNAQEEKKEDEDEANEDEIEGEKKMQQRRKKAKKPAAALMQIEERAVKSVSWGVYAAYIRASGSMLVLPFCILLLVVSQGANICTSLWLSWWTQDKWGLSTGEYIGVYAALGAIQALLMFAFSVALSVFGTEASKVMLHRAINGVLRAPMSFFDTTPLGRITNRFSKDIDTMDNMLTDAIRFFFLTMAMIVSVFILIIVYFYYFAVALGPLLVVFVFSASYYRSSAREIKRHEAVLRSSVFARFSEAVSGISTIRAYGLQDRFSDSVKSAIDEMNSAYFLTFANQRWLSVRLDAIGNLLVLVVGILVVTSRFSVSPSTGGLVLSYILSIVQMIQFTVRQLAEVENNMNATERIHYYGTQLDEEPPLHLSTLPADWPHAGEIEFRDVQMRYRPGLPLVLHDFSLHIRAGERIGIVGRTGAGKSSIMSALFRIVELSGGCISIDGIDLSTVGLADLRSRLAIIPQDPTLFRGSVRSNLDPFGAYTDLQLWSALRQADLVGEEIHTDVDENIAAKPDEKADISATATQVKDETKPSTPATPSTPTGLNHSHGHGAQKASRITLDSVVEEEGSNFSLGQRQLMALARALVRNSQIIVCDEATSSVDMQTDQRIQESMARGFKGKTLLCIAHRLRTIIGYDRIVVMDAGQVAEVGPPKDLFNIKGGVFRSMCERSSITLADFDSEHDRLHDVDNAVLPSKEGEL